MRSRICLIRHGITEGNSRKLYYGQSDIPLSEEGIKELKELKDSGIYPNSENADFYTTGLIRTEQTLEIIYGKREHRSIPKLREINFGDFEMKSHQELKDLEEYKAWIADGNWQSAAPPGGESIGEFQARIAEGFEELKAEHLKKVFAMRHRQEEALSIAVCHGGSISGVMQVIYPNVEENFYGWLPTPGHGYIISMEDGAVTGHEKF